MAYRKQILKKLDEMEYNKYNKLTNTNQFQRKYVVLKLFYYFISVTI